MRDPQVDLGRSEQLVVYP